MFKAPARLRLVLVFFSVSILQVYGQTCDPSRNITGVNPPTERCNPQNDADCCVQGKVYETFTCSLPVSSSNNAFPALNSFEQGGDGGSPSECDKQYHSDDTLIVALSTAWCEGGARCRHYITIKGIGQSARAMIVDECDSTTGCDQDHNYATPCQNNIIDASRAVWAALGVPEGSRGQLGIAWSDS